jgi:hypothetical protein
MKRSTPTVSPLLAGAIITPWVDALCVGGLAVIAVGWMLIARVRFDESTWAAFWFLQIALNYPHFIASYRLLYQSRDMILRYKWASIYVPILLLAYGAFAVIYVNATHQPLATSYAYWATVYVASMYLSLHYTGQAWGMTASFGYVTGTPFTALERRILRAVLYVFMVWHILIYNNHNLHILRQLVPALQTIVPVAYQMVTVLAHTAMAAAVVTFVVIGRRTGRWVPLRVLLPIPALYLGYVLYTGSTAALFVLQLGHSLQYLIFPLRVEMNRQASRTSSPRRRALHLALYAAGLVGAGWVVFMGSARLPGPAASLSMLLIVGVNIHHYFTDGSVWKISTPEVRRDLFRHLGRDAKAATNRKASGRKLSAG